MGLEFHTPKTLCEKWPQGCQFCDLILCDGKKESATIKITQRDFHTCAHGCEESVCLRQHEKYGNCNMYSAKSKQTNADHIRSMTDEDLVEIFANNDCGYCRIHDFCFAKGSAINCEDVWLDWLREESK